MLSLQIKRDVSVISKSNKPEPQYTPELQWASPDVPSSRINRNVCMLGLTIVGDTETYIGPSLDTNPELFVVSQSYTLPVMLNTFRVSVLNPDDSVVRTKIIAAPLVMSIKDRRFRIDPGEQMAVFAAQCFFDKTMIANNPFFGPGDSRNRTYSMFIEFDPLGQVPGAYCNLFLDARFDPNQMRHGTTIEIP